MNEKKLQNVTIDDLPLSPRTYDALKNAGISKIDELKKIPFGELLEIQNFGSRSLFEIAAIFKDLKEQVKRRKFDATGVLEVPDFVADTKLPRPEFSKRLSDTLVSLGIKTIRDTFTLKEKELTKLKNFGRKSFIEFVRYLESKGVLLGREYKIVEGEIPTDVDNPGLPQLFEMLEKFGEQMLHGNDEIQRAIYVDRVTKKQKRTLESIGAQYQLTRERIRQIEAKVHQKISKIIRINIVGVEQLFEKYGNVIDLKAVPEMAPYLKDYPAFKDAVNSGKFNFYIEYFTDLMLRKGTNIPKLKPSTVKVTEKEMEEILTKKLAEIAGKFPNSKDSKINQKSVLKTLKALEIQRNFYYFDRFDFYVRNRYLKAFKTELLEKIFKDLYPEGIRIHIEEKRIYQDYKERCPERFLAATPRALLMRLERCPHIILTNIGCYQHIDTVSVPAEAIDFAVKACNKSKADDPITDIYLANKDYFDSHGVPSKQLLISLLSRRADLNAKIDARQRRRGSADAEFELDF